MELSSKQRAFLMSLANDIDPVIQIGKNGVSPEAVKSADETFNTRELLKGSVLKTAPDDPGSTAEMLAGRCRATVVKVIGRKFILYRKNNDDPRIELPEA
ncbi:MAG: YhbY family RNA-binding protein [Clostridiales bacterium]|jgi:RNA-binding protein|nr:YhbY family RNA-binding protein [Clostridiales bacterium]